MNRGNQAGKQSEGEHRSIPPPPAVTRELIREQLSISGLAEKDGVLGWVAVALVDGLWDMLTGDYKGGTAKRRKDEQLDVVDNTDDESRVVKIVFVYLRVWGLTQGSRMIKMSAALVRHTRVHKHAHTHLQTPRLAWMSTQACCSGLSADGCLLGPWALWGPQETSQEKHSTGLLRYYCGYFITSFLTQWAKK